ncbi:MAG TPA: molybdopterin molybdotransferase MoeA [Desulfobacterales bacterium]|nr:molybdopterin molybdotransferase MoeA [Desulfobacterales bacterium]
MNTDIRMKGFIKRHDIDEVLEIIENRIKPLDIEKISFEQALQRVAAENIIAEENVPSFNRAAMDGYAVRAEDTFGASFSNPLNFELIGELTAGRQPVKPISKQKAIRIMTGAELPVGADAVVMVEDAEESVNEVKIFNAVTPGKNVSRIGEDIKIGDIVIQKGTVLRPQHIGVLASLQVSRIKVYKQPRIAVIVTGEEIISPGEKKAKGQIIDSNSYILTNMIKEHHAIAVVKGHVPDDKGKITKLVKSCTEDIIILTGGTSVGKKDLVPIIISELGEVVVHGIAMRPASPTGFGFVQSRPVFFLVGNPAGAMIAFDSFVVPTIKKMMGLSQTLLGHYRKQKFILSRKVASQIGRTDFVRVKKTEKGVLPIRVSGANILTSMTRADGILIVPKNKEGFNANEWVEVNLF